MKNTELTGRKMRLAIVIINYRTPHFMRDCLASLNGQVDPKQDRVVIVDNASGDGSDDEIVRLINENVWNEWAQLVRSPVNGGFSAGNNKGIRQIVAEYYLLLNSDTIVRPKAIEQLLKAITLYPDVGMFCPRLEWPDARPQESCFRFRPPFYEFFSAARTGLVDRLFAHQGGTYPVSTSPMHPMWTSFACILIRREVFESIGLLDEGFFMYYDDMDFCRRAWDAGIKTLYWPFARFVHLRGGSSPVKKLVSERKRPPRYWYASRSRYYAKFYGLLGLWLANLCWYAGRMISLAREVLRLKEPHTYRWQWIDIWTNALNPLRRPTLPNLKDNRYL
jgi:GT2 family glycosyltransferase